MKKEVEESLIESLKEVKKMKSGELPKFEWRESINNIRYEMDEEMAKKIIDAPTVEIKESGIKNDFFLSKAERLEHAKRVLENWKRNK